MFYTFKDYLNYVISYKDILRKELRLNSNPEFKFITLSLLKALALGEDISGNIHGQILLKQLNEMRYISQEPDIKFLSPIHHGVIYLLSLDEQITFEDYLFLFSLYNSNHPITPTAAIIYANINNGQYQDICSKVGSLQSYPFSNCCFHLLSDNSNFQQVIEHHIKNYISSILHDFDIMLPIFTVGLNYFVTTPYWDLKSYPDYANDMENKLKQLGVDSVWEEESLPAIAKAFQCEDLVHMLVPNNNPIQWCLCSNLPYKNDFGYMDYSYKILIAPDAKLY